MKSLTLKSKLTYGYFTINNFTNSLYNLFSNFTWNYSVLHKHHQHLINLNTLVTRYTRQQWEQHCAAHTPHNYSVWMDVQTSNLQSMSLLLLGLSLTNELHQRLFLLSVNTQAGFCNIVSSTTIEDVIFIFCVYVELVI